MGLTYELKVDNKNRFKFERSGLFGKGDKIKCYLNGEYVDEFDLPHWVLESLNDKNTRESTKRSILSGPCVSWFSEYGKDLLE